MAAPEYVIQLIGLADGRPSPFDGEYLLTYDPHYKNGRGRITSTRDKQKALRFPSFEAVHECWTQSHGLRIDGNPNRPLTAWSVEITRVDDPHTGGTDG